MFILSPTVHCKTSFLVNLYWDNKYSDSDSKRPTVSECHDDLWRGIFQLLNIENTFSWSTSFQKLRIYSENLLMLAFSRKAKVTRIVLRNTGLTPIPIKSNKQQQQQKQEEKASDDMNSICVCMNAKSPGHVKPRQLLHIRATTHAKTR